jgi:hypothetical protein
MIVKHLCGQELDRKALIGDRETRLFVCSGFGAASNSVRQSGSSVSITSEHGEHERAHFARLKCEGWDG